MDLYSHIRIILSVVMGLALTTLLKGIASMIEHPGRHGWSWMHVGWIAWTLISVVAFWWWEFRLVEVTQWTFWSYVFIVGYCGLYFLLASLLFPDDLSDYAGFADYLMRRRAWLFGVIALIAVMDLLDTQLKGAGRWRALGPAYLAHTLGVLAAAGFGIALKTRRSQAALALCAVVYQIGYLTLQYFTLATP